ncbi:MAG: hypothetical protein ACKVT2_02530 [Saprospiraceae bacterium]
MNTRYLMSFLAFVWAINLTAQAPGPAKPYWAAGLFGSIGSGFGVFSQAFEKGKIVSPYTSHPMSGWVGHLDAGISFRNHWGIRASVSGFKANNLTNYIKGSLEGAYPGYVFDYVPIDAGQHETSNQFALGISYAFTNRRWLFQPDLMLGSTKIGKDLIAARVKEIGTHQAFILQYRPGNVKYRSPTLILGGKAAWYLGWYWGVFADARMLAILYNVQYQFEKTAVIEQTFEKESIHLKKTAFGATGSLGIFLQIGRWEKKD